MIAILDYGSGNVRAIARIYQDLNVTAELASRPRDLINADRIVLPGVGSFDQAMRCLGDSGMADLLHQLVVEQRRPVLGICVGMQIMAKGSEEGTSKGLGWIQGQVKKFDLPRTAQGMRVPHMGWNEVHPCMEQGLFSGLNSGARFYFLHSYHLTAQNEQDVLAETDYGGLFTSGVKAGNVYGVQFHPEKSHHWGIRLLKNFAELDECCDRG